MEVLFLPLFSSLPALMDFVRFLGLYHFGVGEVVASAFRLLALTLCGSNLYIYIYILFVEGPMTGEGICLFG